MTKKYTHIFFDLDNTLWDFEQNSRNAMFVTFQWFKLEAVADFNRFFDAYTKHNHSLWESYRKNEVVKKDLTYLRFHQTFSELGVNGVDAVEMNAFYLKEMPEQRILTKDAIPLLEYLKRKGYQLNIITNGFREVQLKKIETSGLKPYFKKVYISEDIKSPKPSREIFEYAVKSSNAKKISSIMIGDDWEVDVLGAVNFGIDAVHFQNNRCQKLIKVSNSESRSNLIYKTGALSYLSEIV